MNFPINGNKTVVCIGHSVGGQLCRHYAKKLPSIKGVILLDSVPVMQWTYAVGAQKGLRPDEIQSQQNHQLISTQAIAAFWPLFIGTPILGVGGSAIQPKDAKNLAKWQITTSRNWYAQNMGLNEEQSACDYECAVTPVVNTADQLNVPVLAITASNSKTTCLMRGLTGQPCKDYTVERDVTISLHQDQAKLGKPWNAVEQCTGVCNHDFVYTKVDYVYSTIMKYIKKF